MVSHFATSTHFGIILSSILLAAAGALASKPISIAEFKARPISNFAEQLTGQALIDYVNSAQPFFEAGEPAMSYKQFKSRLMDPKYLDVETLERSAPIVSAEEIPESFDARERWPNCASIRLIRDQANCGSCWAVSAASTMSDRLCIASGQTRQTLLSDTDILACCGESCGYGCDGGFSAQAWKYAISHGVCSGGPYYTKNVCKPYAFHPCGHHKNVTYYGECPKDNENTPRCREKCLFGYRKTYEEDKVYGKNVTYVPNSEEAIQLEIMTNGPVQAGFTVYRDFSTYKRGVYVHTAGQKDGGHAIKIIGWGVDKDKGLKYWLVSNSWNIDWGENGYFRILRGSDECGIESKVVAGHLKV